MDGKSLLDEMYDDLEMSADAAFEGLDDEELEAIMQLTVEEGD